MSVVNMHEAKTRLSQLVEEVLEGKEVIIARAGKPVAKLVPYSPQKRERTPGRFKGQIEISPDFDQEMAEIADIFEGENE
ncbi:MAG: type II toxin-antitoxin system prevent-host-death family antitoxin [Aquificota bacterium]|nr:MAG: type II toxin-antitoxin system prevent-host-death family antitoxin [Aquificota bacterium]